MIIIFSGASGLDSLSRKLLQNNTSVRPVASYFEVVHIGVVFRLFQIISLVMKLTLIDKLHLNYRLGWLSHPKL